MNKVITINLNGNAFPLEEDGYEALRSYLDTAARRLEGNPDKGEIIADIEQAIADKFRAVLGPHKTVVITAEVREIIAAMGPVEDPSANPDEPASAADSADAAEPPPTGPTPKRLCRIPDGAMIGGVCNGLAAYFGIDVTIVRIGFVLLFLIYGTGFLAYLIMMIIFPKAVTPAEKAAASAGPHTAQEFIRRAKEGYYAGMNTFTDKRARRAWKKNFKREMRDWKNNFRREAHEHTRQWRETWHRHWPQPPRHGAAAFVVFPLLAVFNALIAAVAVFAVVSLIATGAVFGLLLPFSAPLWIGILLLFVLYKIATWPLRAVRHAYYCNGIYGPGYVSPFLGLLESLMWVGLLLVLLWIGIHHHAQIHDDLRHLPRTMRHATDSVRDWWNSR